MAKGTEEKQIVIDKILNTFEGSFLYNGGKELRIPVGDVQIKITLTCAKENVAAGGDTALPGEPIWTPGGGFDELATPTVAEPSQAELDEVSAFMAQLGL